jgi:streptomycin 6-kinase
MPPGDPLVPLALSASAARDPDRTAWIDRLPELVGALLEEWQLSRDGAPTHGTTALVLPVRTSAGTPAALKVTWPHQEAEHEHLALRHWAGHGAVRLLRADVRRWALLLERLHPGEDLTTLPAEEACEVVAGLYARLHLPAPAQLRTLSELVTEADAALRRLPREAPLPRRLVEQVIRLGGSLREDTSTNGTLVHGDLHYENVLAGDREPWLAIDPKPLSGDPHYEVAPLLWNRWEELAATGVRDGVRRRFLAVVDAAQLDEDRARDWVLVRMVHNAWGTIADATRQRRQLAAGDREWLTRCVAVAKAVQ